MKQRCHKMIKSGSNDLEQCFLLHYYYGSISRVKGVNGLIKAVNRGDARLWEAGRPRLLKLFVNATFH